MRKLIVTVAALLALLCAGLAGWPYLEKYRSSVAAGRKAQAIVNEYISLRAYVEWLLGEQQNPNALLLLYVDDLRVIARWSKNTWIRLNAYAELRLAYGRLAQVARKSGDLSGYSRYMRLALGASRDYESVLADYGGASYVLDTEEALAAFVVQMDAVYLKIGDEAKASAAERQQEQTQQQESQPQQPSASTPEAEAR